MLSKILKKTTCASCKFCCVFSRKSLWEVPNFPIEKLEELKNYAVNPPIFTKENDALSLHLEQLYKTNSPDEVVPCSFLDEKKGCTLPDDLKPMQCKIWPFRVIKKDGKNLLVFETTCAALGNSLTSELCEFAKCELVTPIKNYLATRAYISFEDKTGKTKNFPVICSLED
ncbi:MAG: hypothetical protein Q4C78_03410 [Synergistaceae bacterium]|nr:hypothetical protein [Synergistaceae bacterium]